MRGFYAVYAGKSIKGSGFMVQKICSWVFVLLAAVCMPDTMHVLPYSSPDEVEISVSYSGILEFLDVFANPYYYLDAAEFAQDDELEKIRAAAKEATRGCTSDYEKIYAVMTYVADSTYYDHLYLEGIEFRSQKAYDVLSTHIAICLGYSDLASAMLRSIGIPCMTATSSSHAYNFAHDGSRWIFFDPTWASYNTFTVSGEMLYEGYTDRYFDLESEEIVNLGLSHQTVSVNCGQATATFDWESHTAVMTVSK